MVDRQSLAEKKVGFYCTRCKRQLRTQICPLHGIGDTIILETSMHIPLPPAGGFTKKAVKNPPHNKPESQNARIRQQQPETKVPPKPREQANDHTPSDDLFSNLDQWKFEYLESKRRSNETQQKLGATPVKRREAKTEKKESKRRSNKIQDKPEVTSPKRRGKKAEKKETPAPVPVANADDPDRWYEQFFDKINEQFRMKAERKSDDQTGENRKKPWVAYGAAVILLLACAVSFYAFTYPEYARKSLFSNAEKLFDSEQYPEALEKYTAFSKKYPGDSFLPTVMQRIHQIEQIEAERHERELRFQELMSEARTMLAQEIPLSAKTDDAMRLIREILAEAPKYVPALQLRDRIVAEHFDNARAAFDKEKYALALNHYEQVLKIKPDDAEVVSQINRTLALKDVDDRLKNLSRLARTKADIERLRKEKFRLKKQIQLSQDRLQKITRQSNAAEIGVSTQKTVPLTPERDAAELLPENSTPSKPLAKTAESLGIELVSEAKTPEKKPLIVEESFIDGGKKKYVYRANPSLPKEIKSKEFTMVLAECVVGWDGKVEDVTLVSPSKDARIDQIARESFREFRFKPATYKGDPVKFKSIEVIAF